MDEEKQKISYPIVIEEDSEGDFHNPGEQLFRPPTRFEKFKFALLGILALSVMLTILSLALFVGLILAVPLIIAGLFWYWRMTRAFRRNFGKRSF